MQVHPFFFLREYDKKVRRAISRLWIEVRRVLNVFIFITHSAVLGRRGFVKYLAREQGSRREEDDV